MPTDEKPRTIQVRFLTLKAIVQVANALAKLVQQLNRVRNGSGDFVGSNIPVHKSSMLLQALKNKRFLMNAKTRYLTGSFVIPQNCGMYQSSA